MSAIHPHNATDAELEAIAYLVALTRPDWPAAVTTSVLRSHASQVHAADLAIAALRAAIDPAFDTPKTIGWRGAHWDGLATRPAEQTTWLYCDVCSKREDKCASERVGRDDDHAFVPSRTRRPLERAR